MRKYLYRLRCQIPVVILTGMVTVFMTGTAFAAEILIYSNEIREENSNIMILDYDDTGGDVILQFGGTLNERLYWDSAGSQFTFTDDINVQGNIGVSGTVDGVDVSNLSYTSGLTGSILSGHLDGGANKHDASEIDVETAGNITTVGNLETNLGAFDIAIGDRTYTGENYVTDGQALTASIDALDQAIVSSTHAQNTDTGTTANTFILDNDNTGGDVSVQFGATLNERIFWDNAGSQFTFTDDVNIQGNITLTGTVDGVDVAGLETAVGNRVYTEENYVSDGQTVTASIDALDQQVKVNSDALGNSVKKMFITMNDLTVLLDGSANLANLYSGSETGANPHQYYTVKSTQSSLQDLDLKIKVKLPEDFVNFTDASNDLSFFYKNTGTNNTDSKIDILVEDDDGNDAFTAADGQNLFSTSWTQYLDEFDGGSFNPSAGEYLYITIKGYASKDGATYQQPYMGELVLTYTGSNK